MCMKYMKRKIDDILLSWKHEGARRPLIIKGARQIGKTAAVEHFAQANYSCFIEINFVSDPKFKAICADGYSADAIIRNITLLNPSLSFVPGETLIFFDEIQEFPDIATSLKFFSLDGRFDVICSGSLLGISYRRIESVSVGYKLDYEMHGLDFEEFLWAIGRETLPDICFSHMQELSPFSEVELNLLQSLYLDYCLLGGMPAVVSLYADTGTFSGSLALQRQLVLDYEEDVRKYAEGVDQARILNVLRAVPAQLARENKKFQISKVASGARFREYRGCVEWLEEAGIVNGCQKLEQCRLPLKGNTSDTDLKLYYADTGLLLSQYDDEVQDDFRTSRNLNILSGALAENAVAEALVKSGSGLFYFRRSDSSLEEDFFLRTANLLVPVEVKATNGKTKSLRQLISSSSYPDIKFGIKLAGTNLGCSDAIYTFPRFCAFLLRRYLKEMGPQLEERWLGRH